MLARTTLSAGMMGGKMGSQGPSSRDAGSLSTSIELMEGDEGTDGSDDAAEADMSVESEAKRSRMLRLVRLSWIWDCLFTGTGRLATALVHVSRRCDHVRRPSFHFISSSRSLRLFLFRSMMLVAIASGFSNLYGLFSLTEKRPVRELPISSCSMSDGPSSRQIYAIGSRGGIFFSCTAISAGGYSQSSRRVASRICFADLTASFFKVLLDGTAWGVEGVSSWLSFEAERNRKWRPRWWGEESVGKSTDDLGVDVRLELAEGTIDSCILGLSVRCDADW